MKVKIKRSGCGWNTFCVCLRFPLNTPAKYFAARNFWNSKLSKQNLSSLPASTVLSLCLTRSPEDKAFLPVLCSISVWKKNCIRVKYLECFNWSSSSFGNYYSVLFSNACFVVWSKVANKSMICNWNLHDNWIILSLWFKYLWLFCIICVNQVKLQKIGPWTCADLNSDTLIKC